MSEQLTDVQFDIVRTAVNLSRLDKATSKGVIAKLREIYPGKDDDILAAVIYLKNNIADK